MAGKRCSLCSKEVQVAYNLQKYGIQGHVCGACYAMKLKEIYNIKH